MVVTVPDSSRPPTTVSTVTQRLVYKCYAVPTAVPLCATLARLRSASRLLHCLYYMIYWCVVFGVCGVCVCAVYPTRRNGLTDYIYIVDSNYHSRRRVAAYRVAEENGQGAVRAPAGRLDPVVLPPARSDSTPAAH